jgi:hypothetical protein
MRIVATSLRLWNDVVDLDPKALVAMTHTAVTSCSHQGSLAHL